MVLSLFRAGIALGRGVNVRVVQAPNVLGGDASCGCVYEDFFFGMTKCNYAVGLVGNMGQVCLPSVVLLALLYDACEW